MKPRLPSPAMVVAMVALAVGLSGTAVAAVNFARTRARSTARAPSPRAPSSAAPPASSSPRSAPAPPRAGSPRSTSTCRRSCVVRRATSGAPSASSTTRRVLPSRSARCPASAPSPPPARTRVRRGRLDPATTISLANTSGEAVNVMRKVDSEGATVLALPTGTTHEFTIPAAAVHAARRASRHEHPRPGRGPPGRAQPAVRLSA